MADERGIITGHFIAHWGVPAEIRPRSVAGIGELAILEFSPRGGRATWRYATNGMSKCAQPGSPANVDVRTEVYACTSERIEWIDALLAAIVSYPWDHATYLAEGDTINVGQPIDRRESCYTGILLAPPGPADPPTVGLIGGLRDDVLVHQVIGVLPDEIVHAMRHGGKELWMRLLRRGEPVLDCPRGEAA